MVHRWTSAEVGISSNEMLMTRAERKTNEFSREASSTRVEVREGPHVGVLFYLHRDDYIGLGEVSHLHGLMTRRLPLREKTLPERMIRHYKSSPPVSSSWLWFFSARFFFSKRREKFHRKFGSGFLLFPSILVLLPSPSSSFSPSPLPYRARKDVFYNAEESLVPVIGGNAC